MITGLWAEDNDLGFIGVSRTSSVGLVKDEIGFGWTRLGWRRSSLAWVAALMGTISLVLGCDLIGVSGDAISPVLGATR